MGNTSSLAELRVECNCGARRVMSGAMQKEKFVGLCCSGNHPHRPGAKAKICKKSVIPSQRGASNVYFQSQEMQYQFHLGQILLMISWGTKSNY